jgi:hypothetical protein
MIRTRLLTPLAFAAALSFSVLPAHAQHRGGGGSRGSVRGGSVVRVAPRGVIASRGFYQPYYSFRPRISLGIGLWAGYPVAYPSYYGYYNPYRYGYGYGNDYGYAYPPADPYRYGYPPPPAYGYPSSNYPSSNYPSSNYPSSNYPSSNYPSSNYPPSNYPSSNYPSSNYPSSNYPSSNYPPSDYPSAEAPQGANGSVRVQPGSRASGGVSLELTPTNAAVFVDGTYVGTGADFGPSERPLGLTVGRHQIEVRAQGYESITFDADVTTGQVVPFRAALRQR